MKFKFPFQHVMRHRKALENLAQTDFMTVLADLNKQKQILSDMFEAIAQAREGAFKTQTAGGKSAPALSQVEDFIKGQDLRIERQRIKIQDCEKKVEELREILREKAIEYKIIERYKEKKHREFIVETNKIEQKRIDDMSIMRFKEKVKNKGKNEK